MDRTPAENIFHQLQHCMNLIHRTHHDRQADNLSEYHGQGRILELLLEKEGIGQRLLAQHLHIRPSTLSVLLDKLESVTLIQRRQSRKDRRIRQIFLTAKGRALAGGIEKAHGEKLDALLCGLNNEEQTTLSTLLDKLLAGLEHHFGETPAPGCGKARQK